MKKTMVLSLVIATSLLIGGAVGWWANSPGYDLLCSSPAVAVLSKDIEAPGIKVDAGTLVDLRSCEYAERFTISLYYSKNPEKTIFHPRNSAPNIGNRGAEQYEVFPRLGEQQ